MIFKTDGKGTDLNGFLDRGSHLQGELSFETTFRIDGRFTGTVRSSGDLIVGEAGEIEGQIEVGQIFISGTVRGAIVAQKRVEITPTGKVFADLTTPALVIGSGAHFEGRCAMNRGGAALPGAEGGERPPAETQTRPSGRDGKGNRRGEPAAPEPS